MKKDKSRKTKWMSNLLAAALFLAAFCITAYVENEYVSEAAEDSQVTKGTETDAYLGGYSEDGGIDEEAGQLSTAAEAFQIKVEVSLGENEAFGGKTVVVLYSEDDYSEDDELTESETNPEEQQIWYISEKSAPDSDDEWEGYGFESLLPGEEQDSGESLYLIEGTMVYYQVLYTRAGLNVDVILKYEDEDAWWSVEFTGGKAEGAFCIPADGSYQLSVRCSESNRQYEETALDPIEISGTMVYYIKYLSEKNSD